MVDLTRVITPVRTLYLSDIEVHLKTSVKSQIWRALVLDEIPYCMKHKLYYNEVKQYMERPRWVITRIKLHLHFVSSLVLPCDHCPQASEAPRGGIYPSELMAPYMKQTQNHELRLKVTVDMLPFSGTICLLVNENPAFLFLSTTSKACLYSLLENKR